MRTAGTGQVLQLTQDPDTWSTEALLGDFQLLAEAVRAANHLTLGDRTGILEDPHDAVRLIERLEALTERLPQLLEQTRDTTEHAYSRGRIDASDEPRGAASALAAYRDSLVTAAAAFNAAKDALRQARSAIGRLHPVFEEDEA